MARLVLPEQFGLVMMVTAITAIADQFKELGLSTATVQQPEISHQQVSNLFWINIAVSGFIALAICIASPAIATYYREPRLVAITCTLALSFIFSGMMVQHQALLTRQLRLKHTSFIRLSANIISTPLGIYLAWKGFGHWALIWREVARSALLSAGVWAFMPWIPSFPCRRTNVSSMLGFGANLTGANLFGSIAAGSDRFFLGRMWGPEPVAVFRQAYQLLLVPMDQLISPLYQVAQPGLGLLKDDSGRYRRFYLKLLGFVCLATMPFSLFIAVYSTEATFVLLGPKWDSCSVIVCILSIGCFIKQPIESSSVLLITRNRSGHYLLLSIVQNAAFVLACSIGSHWSTIGVATADVLLTYLLVYPKLLFALKDSPISISDLLAVVGRPAACSAMMSATLWATKQAFPIKHEIQSLVIGAIAAPLLFGLSWILTPGGLREFRLLVSDLRQAASAKSLKTLA